MTRKASPLAPRSPARRLPDGDGAARQRLERALVRGRGLGRGAAADHGVGWKSGTQVNLERALKIGDELGGHIVSGHVDGMAEIVERKDEGEAVRFTLEAPRDLAKFIARKAPSRSTAPRSPSTRSKAPASTCC
jgi:hypothetical protein